MPVRDQIANIIRRRIISRTYKGGEHITERAISEELNISTTPVKEAFRVLVTEGLLVTLPRKGTYVSEIAMQNLEQITYIRSSLEGVAAYLASKNATEEEIQNMNDMLENAYQCIQKNDIGGVNKYNTEFHEILRDASRNAYLLNLLSMLRSIDYSVRLLNEKKSIAQIKREYHEHKMISEAVCNRDGEKAESLIISHIRRVFHDTLSDSIKQGME